MPDKLPGSERMPQGVPIQPEIIEPSIVNEAVASPDAARMGVDGVNQEETEQVFSRTHGDGQEFTGTLEQARKVCPALGRMSIENARATLQEEDLAARAAQRGRERREAEAAKENASKTRSDEPAPFEKESKKLQPKQAEHDDGSISIAEIASTDTQHRQVREAAQHHEVLPEPIIAGQGKDSNNHPPDSEVHDLLIRQADAIRLSQVTDEIRNNETLEVVVDEGTKAADLGVEVEFSYSATIADQGLETSKQSDEKIYPTIKSSVDEVVAAHVTDEGPAFPVLAEKTPKLDEAQPDVTERLSLEYLVDEVEQVEMPMILDESPFYESETAEGQIGIEPAQLVMSEETEPVGLQENLDVYKFLGEDEVILLMAGIEPIKAEVVEDADCALSEAYAADTVEGEVFKLFPAEHQTLVSVPELPAPIKEIEAAILQLAESLELAESDETQKVYQILGEMITLPDAIETVIGNTEKDTEQKLKELFIRLFEEIGAEQRPALIESLVKLTQTLYLKKLLPVAIETEDNSQALPDEIGMREFLQKLQHGLSTMKRAVTHFYEIGKSVMRLYAITGNVPQSVTI